ncbi:nucleoside phosphorylase [Roseivirga echinicomitans]|uniref:Uridine phosphorylase n=1 Tax=Roseivirga echinicomitans TaxID=296218 RepID=A0A150XJF3_9BACT|nr:nucleoside phosphorylase [Roseivirga echinicomitans]KYG78868.1 phosphorylase [Roseivirga echinicomitans]
MEKRTIPESELILTNEGAIYHLGLQPEMVADTVIVVGDPDRVAKISKYFDRIDFQVTNRELVTHTGELNGKRISVISSGMGTDNVEILMTELDALVNVDLKKRQVKDKLKALKIIRIGTSGCMQPDIPLDSFLVSKAALGMDSLMSFYPWVESEDGQVIGNKVQRTLGLPIRPYLSEASPLLLKEFQGPQMYSGVTVTAPGFYAPQGREIRLRPFLPDYLDRLSKINTSFGQITNFEMETAGYYAMAKMLGHEMISFNALIANRPNKQFSPNAEKTVNDLIQWVIERL